MDPHIYPGRTGLAPDASNVEEGVNYLRRLRGNTSEGAAADAAPAAKSRGGAVTPTVEWKERRQSPRFRCSGSAEFRAEGSDGRMWGTLTDVSLHGCYLEMSSTFPLGTKVDLILKSCGIRIQVLGTVRASYPSLGMGICFAEIEPEQTLQLKQLIATLTGHNAVSKTGTTAQHGMKDALATADPRAVLGEIAEFFQKNQLLSREEFHQIAKRVRRS